MSVIPADWLYRDTINFYCLSMESIRLGGLAHGIVTKTVHKTLPGGGGGPGWEGRGDGVQEWVGRGGGFPGVGG